MIVPVQSDDELARDFAEADKVSGAIHVWWLGQSGFLIKWDGMGLLIDPYLSESVTRSSEGSDTPLERVSPRVIDPLKLSGIDLVVSSSTRPDRLDPETILALRAANPSLKLVVPAGIARDANDALGKAGPPILGVNAGTFVKVDAFDIHGIEAATPKIHVDGNRNSKFLGFAVLFGPFSIYFSGETVWHSQLVRQVRRWPVNLAILPINGVEKSGESGDTLNGFEAAALSKAISASIAVPCHYDMFEPGNVSTDEFVESCERLGQRYRLLKLGQRMTMGPVSDPGAGKALPSEPYRDDTGLGY